MGAARAGREERERSSCEARAGGTRVCARLPGGDLEALAWALLAPRGTAGCCSAACCCCCFRCCCGVGGGEAAAALSRGAARAAACAGGRRQPCRRWARGIPSQAAVCGARSVVVALPLEIQGDLDLDKAQAGFGGGGEGRLGRCRSAGRGGGTAEAPPASPRRARGPCQRRLPRRRGGGRPLSPPAPSKTTPGGDGCGARKGRSRSLASAGCAGTPCRRHSTALRGDAAAAEVERKRERRRSVQRFAAGRSAANGALTPDPSLGRGHTRRASPCQCRRAARLPAAPMQRGPLARAGAPTPAHRRWGWRGGRRVGVRGARPPPPLRRARRPGRAAPLRPPVPTPRMLGTHQAAVGLELCPDGARPHVPLLPISRPVERCLQRVPVQVHYALPVGHPARRPGPCARRPWPSEITAEPRAVKGPGSGILRQPIDP
jgi:hypothetical protein